MQGKKGKFGCFTDDGFAIGVAYILSVLKQVRIPPGTPPLLGCAVV